MKLFLIPHRTDLNAEEIAAALRVMADEIEARTLTCLALKSYWETEKGFNVGQFEIKLSRALAPKRKP